MAGAVDLEAFLKSEKGKFLRAVEADSVRKTARTIQAALDQPILLVKTHHYWRHPRHDEFLDPPPSDEETRYELGIVKPGNLTVEKTERDYAIIIPTLAAYSADSLSNWVKMEKDLSFSTLRFSYEGNQDLSYFPDRMNARREDCDRQKESLYILIGIKKMADVFKLHFGDVAYTDRYIAALIHAVRRGEPKFSEREWKEDRYMEGGGIAILP